MSGEPVPPSINPNARIALTAVVGGPPPGVQAWTLPPALVEGNTDVGDHAVVYAGADVRAGVSGDNR